MSKQEVRSRITTEMSGLLQKLSVTWASDLQKKSEALFSLDTKIIADVSVVQTVREVERIGQDIYAAFVRREKKVFDPIKKNSISLFRITITKVAQLEKSKLNLLKNGSSLISCQARGGNFQEFRKH